MDIEQIKIVLEQFISKDRYEHSINVMNSASELALRYGEAVDKAVLAGLLHDCGRGIKAEEFFDFCEKSGIMVDGIMKAQPLLLHGSLGAVLARTKFGVEDPQVLGAIACHTAGREGMNLLDKIIYMADFISADRNFEGVEEARKLAFEDIDKAMIYALDITIKHVMTKGTLIQPEAVSARNFILMNKGRYK